MERKGTSPKHVKTNKNMTEGVGGVQAIKKNGKPMKNSGAVTRKLTRKFSCVPRTDAVDGAKNSCVGRGLVGCGRRH